MRLGEWGKGVRRFGRVGMIRQTARQAGQHDNPFEAGGCSPPLGFPPAALLPAVVQARERELIEEKSRGVESPVQVMHDRRERTRDQSLKKRRLGLRSGCSEVNSGAMGKPESGGGE